MHTKFIPKIVTVFQEGYRASMFRNDLIAGIVVGIVAFPMSIAFAMATGARPEQGLYTAIVAGFLASLFSGSRHQITGPTGAFIVLISSVMIKHGYEGLVIATLMAGVILIAMGLARLGNAIRFIPYPVTIGFTSGIAVLIANTQLHDFSGLVWKEGFSTLKPLTLGIGTAAVAVIVLWGRVTRWVPGSLVALVVVTAAAQLFNLPLETINDRFGTISASAPSFNFPHIDLAIIPELLPAAIAIALLAGIESLLSAVVADGMTGRRHRSNMELVGQGIANLGSIACGGIPATGAIVRTATNIKTGGETPVSGLVHAVTVLILFVFLGAQVGKIPLVAISAMLMVTAYNMSEWRHFKGMMRSPAGDIAILLVTFFLTVFVDLITAIEVGILLAMFIFVNRIAEVTHTADIKQILEDNEEEPLKTADLPPQTEVFEIRGSLFFAAAEKFKLTLSRMSERPRVLIVRMRHVLHIDATGSRAIRDILLKCQREGTSLLLSGVRPEVRVVLDQTGLLAELGHHNVHSKYADALAAARNLVEVKS